MIKDWPMSKDEKAVQAEEVKLLKLRKLMDFIGALLWQADLTLEEAQKLIAGARTKVLALFPDKGATFELIYGSRFHRILIERYHLQ